MIRSFHIIWLCLLFFQCSSMQQKVCNRDFAYKEGMQKGIQGQSLNSNYRDYCADAPKFGEKSYDKYLSDGHRDGVKFFCDEKQISLLGKKHVYQYLDSNYNFIKKLCGKLSASKYLAHYRKHQKKVCQYNYWLNLGKKDALSGNGAGDRVQALNLCPLEQRDNFSRAYTTSYETQIKAMEEASW